MNIENLHKRLAPFRSLCSRNALAAHYKALELSPGMVRGCASYGIMEVGVELDMPAGTTCYVDAHTFLSVVSSLPEKKELHITIEGGALVWTAGEAKGKLALVEVKGMPQIPETEMAEEYAVTKEFIYALQCGTLSCSDQSLATVGMYGIVLDNRDFPAVCTSDNTTAAFCAFADEPVPGFPDLCTLPPDAVKLLSEIITPGAQIIFTADGKGVYYCDDAHVFYVKTVEPIKHDIRELVDNYSAGNTVVPIPPERIRAFIKRAAAIAESKRSTFVSMGAEQGHLFLSFAEGASTADEYYLVEDKHVPDMQDVQLDANKLARALEQATELVMDYMGKGVVVLSNSETAFLYVVSGRAA